MKTERRGAAVKTITHPKTKRATTLRLDKSSMTFFARIPDEDQTLQNSKSRMYFESKDGNEVERWIKTNLAKQPKSALADWKPVIEIAMEERDEPYYRQREYKSQGRAVNMKIDIDRYYLALNAEQTQWSKLEWSHLEEGSTYFIEPEDRLVQAKDFRQGPKAIATHRWDHVTPFKIPSTEGNTSYVAYTEELWSGLNAALDQLELARKTMRELVATKKGLATLAEVGRGRLQLGSGDITPHTTPEETPA